MINFYKMCGIIALFPEDSGEYSPEIVTGVIKAFKHLKNRGPDCGSLVFRDKEILGFRRLSIIDQSIKGEQPFYSEKSRLLCNGEIYNHKLLKKDYDIQCYSDSDCECILHLYDRFGFANPLNQLTGG